GYPLAFPPFPPTEKQNSANFHGSCESRRCQKKRPAVPAERFCVSRREMRLVNFDEFRITRANHLFAVDKAVHVNRDPAAVHEDEVGVPDQPEMVRSKSLDEELLRMPPKAEHFTVTRPELLFVYGRFLARARARSSFTFVHVLSA